MRFRTKILLSVALLLAMSLSAVGIVQWGVIRSQSYLARSQLAHEQLELHLDLARDSYKVFKRGTDALLAGVAARPLDADGLHQPLRDDLDRIAQSIRKEVAFVGREEKSTETEELDRLSAIERQVNLTHAAFKEIEALQRQGDSAGAWLRLSGLMRSDMDEVLNRQLEAAVADEQAEVERTDAEAERLLARLNTIARLHAGLAILLTAAFSLVLIGRLRRPLAALLAGTRALAGGDLAHRIRIGGRDEFADLGGSFNRMAADLQSHQEALGAAQARLEIAVADRTEELRQANQALRQQDEARRGFFADISHELRTPLTVIRGEAEIALRGREKEIGDYKSALRRIVEQARHTGALINDLLFIARQGTGGSRLELQPVRVGPLIEEACGAARVMADDRGISVHCGRDRELTLIGDPQRLRQLLMILLDNAIRYSDDRSEVEIEARELDGDIVVEVADHGIGIPPSEIGVVFERFRRGGNAVQHNAEGLGLGLPVAKAIVEAHSGVITMESRLGEGTRATVRLPVAPEGAIQP